jgi:hypothetical protein
MVALDPDHMYTVKKAFRYSRHQPGCHLPNSPWAGIVISYINYSRLGRVWEVTSRLGTGISKSFFYGVVASWEYYSTVEMKGFLARGSL